MLKFNPNHDAKLAQKIRSIVRANYNKPDNVPDELASTNNTDISIDISPLAEYFIKANTQIQELARNIFCLLEEQDGMYSIPDSAFNDVSKF